MWLWQKKYNCISVCVRPSDIEIVKPELEDTDIIITTVIGFPHVTCTTETKVFETEDALAKGTEEVDMVLNIGRLKSGDFDYVVKISEQLQKQHTRVELK